MNNARSPDTRSFVTSVVWATLATASAWAQPQAIHLGEPPVAATMPCVTTHLVATASMHAAVTLDTTDKRVTVLWKYSPNGSFSGQGVAAAAQQVLAVGFWPTAAEVVAPNKIIVSGKERNSGDTRIEVWTVPKPLMSFPAAGGAPVLHPQSVSNIDVVYEAAVAGRDMVKAMLRVRGKPSSVFVQFYDSRDLYEMDWGTSPYPMVLILSAASEPALAIDDYDTYLAGDHKVKGYVYVFGAEGTLGLTSPLVFFDSNRDGVIDSHGPMTIQAYHAQDLAKQSEYYEHSGLVY